MRRGILYSQHAYDYLSLKGSRVLSEISLTRLHRIGEMLLEVREASRGRRFVFSIYLLETNSLEPLFRDRNLVRVIPRESKIAGKLTVKVSGYLNSYLLLMSFAVCQLSVLRTQQPDPLIDTPLAVNTPQNKRKRNNLAFSHPETIDRLPELE